MQRGRGGSPARAVLVVLACCCALAVPTANAAWLTVQGATVHTGTEAVEVRVDGTCEPDHLDIPAGTEYVDAQTEVACLEIAAGDAQVLTDADVVFWAGTSVGIGSGFAVARGASFRIGTGGVGEDAYLVSDHPSSTGEYWARFYLNPDQLAMPAGSAFRTLVGFDEGGERELAVVIERDGEFANHRVWIEAADDTQGTMSTDDVAELDLAGGWHFLELRWVASSGADDGSLEICVDGSPGAAIGCIQLLGLDNDGAAIRRVAWGALDVPALDLGVLHLDDFRAEHSGPLGPCDAATCP